MQPTSLPVSERLRFFSRLTEAANRSNCSSYTRSPPFGYIERSASTSSYQTPSTPRSSTSASSASVTPTPMEYIASSITETDHQQQQLMCINDTAEQEHDASQDVIKTSEAFLQLSKSASQNFEATPTQNGKRMKLKFIGKLLLPKPFVNNDRNNNTKTSQQDSESDELAAHKQAVKKIGKIKSPFIENCQQLLQKQQQLNSKCMKYDLKSTPHNALASVENSDHNNSGAALRKSSSAGGNVLTALQNGGDDANADSGKENYEHNTTGGGSEQVAPLAELRKKFPRSLSNTLSMDCGSRTATVQHRHTHASSRNSSGNSSRGSLLIDEKYAKYFGLAAKEKEKEKEKETKRQEQKQLREQIKDLNNCLEQATKMEQTFVLKSSNQLPDLPFKQRSEESEKNLKKAQENLEHISQNSSTTSLSLLKSFSQQLDMLTKRSSQDFDEFRQDRHSGVDTSVAAAINHNVSLSGKKTPVNYPLTPAPSRECIPAEPCVVSTTPLSTSELAAVSSNSSLKRGKRRALTTVVSSHSILGTPPSIPSSTGTPGSTARLQRMPRAHTITHGIPLEQQVPQLKSFEDIVVTKEELQQASHEFDRIFLGVV